MSAASGSVLHRHAQHLGLLAVEVDEQLLAVGADGRVDAGELGPLPRLGEDPVDDVGELRVVARALLLIQNSKPPVVPRPGIAGGLSGDDQPSANAANCALEPRRSPRRRDSVGRLRSSKSFSETNKSAGVGLVLRVDQAVAVDLRDVRDRRMLADDLAGLRGRRAPVRSRLAASGRKYDDEEVALVLVRHEAAAGRGTSTRCRRRPRRERRAARSASCVIQLRRRPRSRSVRRSNVSSNHRKKPFFSP